MCTIDLLRSLQNSDSVIEIEEKRRDAARATQQRINHNNATLEKEALDLQRMKAFIVAKAKSIRNEFKEQNLDNITIAFQHLIYQLAQKYFKWQEKC